jgi:AraC family transcriptional regulator, transcriptional activator of pobA
MDKSLSIEDFYKSKPELNFDPNSLKNNNGNEMGHFNVFSRSNLCNRVIPYNRRDFYKVSLIVGTGNLNYADKAIEINKNAMLFSNPNVPYSWEPISKKQEGFFCLFTNEFITNNRNINLIEHPLFKVGGEPVYFIDEEQTKALSYIFEKMLDEIKTDYIYKYDLLRNYLDIIIHEALKLQPADTYYKHINASSRITSLFIELLERQFPIDSPENILQLKSPTDFAQNLSLHVNHLNRAVKEVTGKTTTTHIADRIVKEAKALLVHTDWNVSEIAYSLGFEYPTYFNNFFKKHTELSPKSLRN